MRRRRFAARTPTTRWRGPNPDPRSELDQVLDEVRARLNHEDFAQVATTYLWDAFDAFLGDRVEEVMADLFDSPDFLQGGLRQNKWTRLNKQVRKVLADEMRGSIAKAAEELDFAFHQVLD